MLIFFVFVKLLSLMNINLMLIDNRDNIFVILEMNLLLRKNIR